MKKDTNSSKNIYVTPRVTPRVSFHSVTHSLFSIHPNHTHPNNTNPIPHLPLLFHSLSLPHTLSTPSPLTPSSLPLPHTHIFSVPSFPTSPPTHPHLSIIFHPHPLHLVLHHYQTHTQQALSKHHTHQTHTHTHTANTQPREEEIEREREREREKGLHTKGCPSQEGICRATPESKSLSTWPSSSSSTVLKGTIFTSSRHILSSSPSNSTVTAGGSPMEMLPSLLQYCIVDRMLIEC